MKLASAALAIATLCASTASFAGMVSTSSNVNFLAINGQKASKALSKQTKAFNADNGKTQQVVVQVEELVGNGDKQHLFESSPIIVTFQASNEDVVISAPTLNSRADADKFQKSPNLKVTTKSGADVATKQDILQQDGLFPSANIVDDIAEYNSENKGVAAVPALAVATAAPAMAANANGVPANAKTAKGKVTVQGENVAEQMLQYWYQQADKETQTRFLDWVKKQK